MIGYKAVNEEEVTAAARVSYKHDIAHYRRIDEVAFKDILSESIGRMVLHTAVFFSAQSDSIIMPSQYF